MIADKKKESGFMIAEPDAKRLEVMAADFLAARGYAVFDGALAHQMLAIVAKSNVKNN